MGPENEFRVTLAGDSVPPLSGEDDFLDFAVTLVPPIVAPVTLVRTIDGRQTRWSLKLTAGTGVSTRCRLAVAPAPSTCGASLGDAPLLPAGDWSLEANGNHVLEAGMAFRICR